MWIFFEKMKKAVDKTQIKKYIIPLNESELYQKLVDFYLDFRKMTQKPSKWLIGKIHIRKMIIKTHNGIL